MGKATPHPVLPTLRCWLSCPPSCRCWLTSYDHLSLLQKVEVFEHTLESTQNELRYFQPVTLLCVPLKDTAVTAVHSCALVMVTSFALCRIWPYGCGAFFVAIVVSGTRPRIQEFSGVSLSCSVVTVSARDRVIVEFV